MTRHPVHQFRTLPWFGWWAAAHAGLLLVLLAFQWDERLSGTFCSWGSGGTSRTRTLETLTTWGNPWPVTLIAAGSACFALTRRNIAAAAVLLAVPYAATVSCNLIKGWAERPRPTLQCASAQADGFSFPSGHAVGVTTGFLLAALYLSTHTPRAVSALILLLTGLAAELVAWSRVILGVHFSIDVLAGQLLGAGWLAIAALMLHHQSTRRLRREARQGVPNPVDEPVP
ncbi:phosphatase PAP2 family protein [Streptomyces triculaminicus]|uniref:phosphatase PAP2 family protein n=1 Tax=Streptomyces triculaminicus TaxID=2816232 RepID=UPI0037AAFA24